MGWYGKEMVVEKDESSRGDFEHYRIHILMMASEEPLYL
jgi:hypothetical protein